MYHNIKAEDVLAALQHGELPEDMEKFLWIMREHLEIRNIHKMLIHILHIVSYLKENNKKRDMDFITDLMIYASDMSKESVNDLLNVNAKDLVITMEKRIASPKDLYHKDEEILFSDERERCIIRINKESDLVIYLFGFIKEDDQILFGQIKDAIHKVKWRTLAVNTDKLFNKDSKLKEQISKHLIGDCV